MRNDKWREKKSAPHTTEKTTLLRMMTLLDDYDEASGRWFSRPRFLLGSSSSRGLSLSCFLREREESVIPNVEGRALVAKPNCHHPKEKKKEEKNDFDDFDAANEKKKTRSKTALTIRFSLSLSPVVKFDDDIDDDNHT